MDKIDTTLNDWGNYLRESDDITSLTNLSYFKLLLRNLKGNFSYLDNQPIINHKLGGFLSWEVLKVTGEVSYIVDFHVFGKGSTFVHSHGYDCNSFVLGGEISYEHFTVEEIPLKLHQLKASSLKDFDTEGHLLDTSVKNDISDIHIPEPEMLKLVSKNFGYSGYQEVIYFAKLFGENPYLIPKIEKELLNYSIGKITFRELSQYVLEFLIIFLNNEADLIRGGKSYLLNSFYKIVALYGYNSYLSSDNAHKVDVENNAFTLFIKRFDSGEKLPGGNFKFIEQDGTYNRDGVSVSKELSYKVKVALNCLNI